MTKDSRTVSFDCPPELFERMEAEVEDSIEHENRSQFIRTAIRAFMRDDEDDFSKAN